MPTMPATGEAPASASVSDSRTAGDSRPQPRRQHACVLCQQRKVKCDHRNPCATCVKAKVQCVPVYNPRRRRRRFPERELLDRLHTYQDLLAKHNIKFEPLHPGNAQADKSASKTPHDFNVEGHHDSGDEPGSTVDVSSSPAVTASSERRRVHEAKYILPRIPTILYGADQDL